MTACIVYLTRFVNILILFMMSCLPQSFCMSSIILRADLIRFICIYISNTFCREHSVQMNIFLPITFFSKGNVFVIFIFGADKI